ncbi:methionyl-tRNA synthetase / methionine--tRNA ligase / MetRS (cpMetRS) [Raphanus sativus]|uniref:methionine--tRNA ligase n=1 Tax=Raphanus sativus TaxID=3726 RepID=A0A6J0P9P6_RAPSA|nr:methionine--tRNA ligase, chloroplastic/mitochondrial [Raphanus sativus]KAJ4895886.1 methionyl-tRNA synthetase / methionine--tRNA ligase / MetRS (cpMetRS) [Raphanus sativus]
MAARLNSSFHNALSFLNPFNTPLSKKPFSSRNSFRFSKKLASSPTRRALYSTSTLGSHENADTFVLTTPLYYVNAPPHMGSAYTTIAADSIARFQRLLGKKVIFITGTDEHGEKIATSAAANGRNPAEHCDLISQSYRTLWKELDIAYDKFVRTTDPKHEAIVKEFYERVFANGDIYRADYEGLYCVNCEEYKDEKELLENNCCPVHQMPCVARKEDNYFFALSKYQKPLEEVLSQNPRFVQPPYRLNEVQTWIKSGLRDFSISRALVDWGIPVPNDDKQTIYVWFDALLGYISALTEDNEQQNLDTAVSLGWPASLHLIGKDILRFHAVYWPAMLMSAGLNLPKMVFGHGFLTKDGMKMGKSLGNTLEPFELVQKFGPDAVRYFFIREVEFGNDGDYSEDRFIKIVNAHLANTIGNLLNRTLGLLKKNCESTLVVDSTIAAEGVSLKDTVEKLVEKARTNYENLSLSTACEAVLEIGNAGNSYMDQRAPWMLFKQGGDSAEAAAKDLVIILEVMRIIAVALSPIAPSLSLKIYSQLGFSVDQFNSVTWNDTKWGELKGGQVMAQASPVFVRIELDAAEKDEEKKPKDSKKKGKAKVKVEQQPQIVAEEA